MKLKFVGAFWNYFLLKKEEIAWYVLQQIFHDEICNQCGGIQMIYRRTYFTINFAFPFLLPSAWIKKRWLGSYHMTQTQFTVCCTIFLYMSDKLVLQLFTAPNIYIYIWFRLQAVSTQSFDYKQIFLNAIAQHFFKQKSFTYA